MPWACRFAATIRSKKMLWKITAALHALLKRFKTDTTYRPERHYMRGPGPKSRALAGSLEPRN
jgi:hypothetical protein